MGLLVSARVGKGVGPPPPSIACQQQFTPGALALPSHDRGGLVCLPWKWLLPGSAFLREHMGAEGPRGPPDHVLFYCARREGTVEDGKAALGLGSHSHHEPPASSTWWQKSPDVLRLDDSLPRSRVSTEGALFSLISASVCDWNQTSTLLFVHISILAFFSSPFLEISFYNFCCCCLNIDVSVLLLTRLFIFLA